MESKKLNMPLLTVYLKTRSFDLMHGGFAIQEHHTQIAVYNWGDASETPHQNKQSIHFDLHEHQTPVYNY